MASAQDAIRCEKLIEPGSNGLVVTIPDPEKNELVVTACEHGNRRIVVNTVPTDETMTNPVDPQQRDVVILAETFNSHPLNSPNDLAMHPVTGDIFFTDPPYGLIDTDVSEQGFNGIYLIDAAYAASRREHRFTPQQPTLLEPRLASRDFTKPVRSSPYCAVMGVFPRLGFAANFANGFLYCCSRMALLLHTTGGACMFY